MTEYWDALPEDEKARWLQEAALPQPEAEVVAASSVPSKRSLDGRCKGFLSKTKRYQSEDAESLATSLQEAGGEDDVVAFMLAAVSKLETTWPGLREKLANAVTPEQAVNCPDCNVCTQLLRGLGSLGDTVAGYDAPYPSSQLHAVRSAIDKACRAALPDQKELQKKGYAMGRFRWNAAGQNAPAADRKPRGRPTQVDKQSNIKAVEEALQKYAQPSSEPCLDSKRDWVEAQILTKRHQKIFAENEDLQRQMSSRVFSGILKRHCCHFKKPRRLTDYCQICADFDDKVLPQCRDLVQKSRAELETQLPRYFEACPGGGLYLVVI